MLRDSALGGEHQERRGAHSAARAERHGLIFAVEKEMRRGAGRKDGVRASSFSFSCFSLE